MLRKLIGFLHMKMMIFFVSCALGLTLCLLHSTSSIIVQSSSRYCAPQTNIDNQYLPSHRPSNHCETQAQTITWMNWLIGNSLTNQLHFIDFLELLHGNNRIPLSQVTLINSHQSLQLC